MILLDAIYINNSGGKVLLDYLVRNFEEKRADIFYLLDERCSQDYKDVPANRKLFMEGSVNGRRKFYAQHGERFSGVLCFGNIPPPVDLGAAVMTYLHQPLYLEQPAGTPLAKLLKLKLKGHFIRSLRKNTDHWAVQSDNIAGLLQRKWGIRPERIKVLPFYPPLEHTEQVPRSDNKYLFVSNGNPHKNHYRLIEAFSKFNKDIPEAELHLTVSTMFPAVMDHIALCQKQGTKIINHGLQPRSALARLYKSAGFLLYPSLTESFGLGLMEAIELGCKVIASDLPYVHAVCKPTLVFDPMDTNAIYKALLKSRSAQLPPSELTITNQINSILSYFSYETVNTIL